MAIIFHSQSGNNYLNDNNVRDENQRQNMEITIWAFSFSLSLYHLVSSRIKSNLYSMGYLEWLKWHTNWSKYFVKKEIIKALMAENQIKSK